MTDTLLNDPDIALIQQLTATGLTTLEAMSLIDRWRCEGQMPEDLKKLELGIQYIPPGMNRRERRRFLRKSRSSKR